MKVRSIAFLLGVVSAAFGDTAPLQTVDHVDLSQYVGRWYEVARYPNRFEKDCVSDVTANYSLKPNGKIEVLNQCRNAEGKMKTSKGTATIADRNSNAKLKVTFFWPFYGNYWVIGIDPEYRFAVVSEPKRKYLWILSRTPVLDQSLYDSAIQIIREKGLDPSKLIKPVQTASSTGFHSGSEP